VLSQVWRFHEYGAFTSIMGARLVEQRSSGSMESQRKPKVAAGYINLLLKLRVYESLQGSCRVYRSFALDLIEH
jgi:hypothetical protein